MENMPYFHATHNSCKADSQQQRKQVHICAYLLTTFLSHHQESVRWIYLLQVSWGLWIITKMMMLSLHSVIFLTSNAAMHSYTIHMPFIHKLHLYQLLELKDNKNMYPSNVHTKNTHSGSHTTIILCYRHQKPWHIKISIHSNPISHRRKLRLPFSVLACMHVVFCKCDFSFLLFIFIATQIGWLHAHTEYRIFFSNQNIDLHISVYIYISRAKML